MPGLTLNWSIFWHQMNVHVEMQAMVIQSICVCEFLQHLKSNDDKVIFEAVQVSR